MPDILHKVGIQKPLGDVFAALTTPEGLAGWWTNDASGVGDCAGGALALRFGVHGFDLEVEEVERERSVLWRVVDGPEEWIGTRIRFDLKHEGGYTIVLFRHQDWKEPVEFMHHCSTKWAVFLLSLKSLVETGKGAPYPDDIKIDNWN